MSFLSNMRKRLLGDAKEIGVSGQPTAGGFLVTQERNSDLIGDARYRTYSDILANVSIVAAGVRYFLNLSTKPSWNVIPANNTDGAKKAADFVYSVMNDMEGSWRKAIRRSAMYRFYGFSVQEWVAKHRDDGAIGIAEIATRPQRTIERWDVDTKGRIQGMWQLSPHDYQEIYLPRRKLIYIVDDSLNDSPEGLGLFRHIVEPARRLQRYEKLEGYGFESDLRGVPLGRAPYGALKKMVDDGKITQAQMDEILSPLIDFMENHIKSNKTGLLLDSSTYRGTDEGSRVSPTPMWNMELLKAGITSQSAVAEAIQRLTTELARVIGVEGLLLGGQGRGSLALSRDKSNNFYLIVESTQVELAEVYEKDLLRPLWILNGLDKKLLPRLKPDSIQSKDMLSVIEGLELLAKAGTRTIPSDPAVNIIRQGLGLPELPVELQEKALNQPSERPKNGSGKVPISKRK